MFERTFVGHRFDEDTPIAETVSAFTSEVDGVIISHVQFSDASAS